MMVISRSLYPFDQDLHLDLDGLRYHYVDEGEGEPVVMVHGNPSWSFYYRNLALALRDRFRVIVPDHIGCGLSDKPDDSRYTYTLSRRVDDLEALLEHLGLDHNLTLVLHDWGGMIGMAYAVRHPQRIRRLVILNTAAFHKPAGKPLPWQLWLVRNTWLGSLLVRGGNAFARGAAWVGCTRKRLSREIRNAYCAPYDSWANRIATLRFVQDIPIRPEDPAFDVVTGVEERLTTFADRPALICWGMKDFVFDATYLERWCDGLPGAQVHRFADCGHYVLEDAGNEIAELVIRFLDENQLQSEE
jgi:haloalkane dehalogenase